VVHWPSCRYPARNTMIPEFHVSLKALCNAAKCFVLAVTPLPVLRLTVVHVPSWFFTMARDDARNTAFETAICRAIGPGSRVLEIGTGTGLIAMMAARAGAAEVITCETSPAVAATAAEVIARNGFADQVRVIEKSSTDLKVGVDLAEPADVLLWDVLDNTIVGAGGLPLVEHAVQHLLRPGAPVIPARGSIRIALIEDHFLPERQMPISAKGFDLAAFNQLERPWYYVSEVGFSATQRSDPADVLRFDFQSGALPKARASVSLSSSGGIVNGIIQWLRLEMDAAESYENLPFPRLGLTAHRQRVWPLERPLNMACGTTLSVRARHNRRSLRLSVGT
jgi:type III protein arginine methyltransferase